MQKTNEEKQDILALSREVMTAFQKQIDTHSSQIDKWTKLMFADGVTDAQRESYLDDVRAYRSRIEELERGLEAMAQVIILIEQS